jgi:hypothetical protein
MEHHPLHYVAAGHVVTPAHGSNLFFADTAAMHQHQRIRTPGKGFDLCCICGWS